MYNNFAVTYAALSIHGYNVDISAVANDLKKITSYNDKTIKNIILTSLIYPFEKLNYSIGFIYFMEILKNVPLIRRKEMHREILKSGLCFNNIKI